MRRSRRRPRAPSFSRLHTSKRLSYLLFFFSFRLFCHSPLPTNSHFFPPSPSPCHLSALVILAGQQHNACAAHSLGRVRKRRCMRKCVCLFFPLVFMCLACPFSPHLPLTSFYFPHSWQCISFHPICTLAPRPRAPSLALIWARHTRVWQ